MTVQAILIGLVAGVCGGLFGIGGGIVIVPALIWALNFSQIKAQGTSLVALLAPVGLLAVGEYWRKGEVDLKIGGLVALGFLLGSFGGSRLALELGETAMRKGFAVFLVAIGIYMWFRK